MNVLIGVLAFVLFVANVCSAWNCFDTFREHKDRWFLLTGVLNVVAAAVCLGYLGHVIY